MRAFLVLRLLGDMHAHPKATLCSRSLLPEETYIFLIVSFTVV